MKKNIIEAMSFKAISAAYIIGRVKIGDQVTEVNQLKDAIEDGTIEQLVVQCANELHGGDVYRAFAEWSRVLSSTQTNLKKADARSRALAGGNLGRDWVQYNLLREYVTRRMGELKQSKATGARAGHKNAYSWTIEEIEALPEDDVDTLKHIYDGMMSRKSKSPDKIEDMGAYLRTLDVVSTRYSKAKQMAKAKEATIEVSATILDKLSKGSKVTLSKGEAAELAALLEKLNG